MGTKPGTLPAQYHGLLSCSQATPLSPRPPQEQPHANHVVQTQSGLTLGGLPGGVNKARGNQTALLVPRQPFFPECHNEVPRQVTVLPQLADFRHSRRFQRVHSLP